MVLQVDTGQMDFKIGDFVVFITGEKKVGTFPKYMRIGKVTKLTEKYGFIDEVEEISTGKKWNPYASDVIKVGDGIPIKGVTFQMVFTENVQ